MPTPAELAAAVDELAIRGLIAAYADVVNRQTWADLDALFLADAPIRLDLRDRPVIEATGPAAIGEFIAGAIERFAFFEFVALNVRVLFDAADPDRARVRTYMVELRQDHAGVPSRAFGLYQDDVVRGAGSREWRFAARDYQSVGRGDLPGGLELLGLPDIR